MEKELRLHYGGEDDRLKELREWRDALARILNEQEEHHAARVELWKHNDSRADSPHAAFSHLVCLHAIEEAQASVRAVQWVRDSLRDEGLL